MLSVSWNELHFSLCEWLFRKSALIKKLFRLTVVTISLFWVNTAWAEDLVFLLINESSSPVVSFYVSPASSGDWESNLMAGGFLDSGYEIDVLIADGMETCEYDIRADFEDGEVIEDFGLDLCDLGSYTFE